MICAVPFPGHSKPFGSKWKDIYKELTEKAAEVYFICEKYSSESFDLRDKWMVDRADMVIAAYNGMPGGTKKTVYYANMKGLPVKNILEVHENKASHD